MCLVGRGKSGTANIFLSKPTKIESTQFGVKTQIEISENILDKIAQANVQSFLTNQNRKITKILLIDSEH